MREEDKEEKPIQRLVLLKMTLNTDLAAGVDPEAR
jgi:hypothetical protein